MTPPAQRALLERIARSAMLAHGLSPDWPPEMAAELAHLADPPRDGLRDLRDLPWSSIDNADSRDLDQVEVCLTDGGRTRLLIGLADVAGMVTRGSALDEHARLNTTSVYTPVRVFPMLPEVLSTDRTSLNLDQDRPAIVVDLTVDDSGAPTAWDVYPARLCNRARLSYGAVSAWLEGSAPLPASALGAALETQLRLQDRIATALRARSHEEGALEFARTEIKPTLVGESVVDLQTEGPNRARDMIESFMVAANGATARFLSAHGFASIRRVVRSPSRWGRIVDLAGAHGGRLPAEPDSKALAAFLRGERQSHPDTFGDLSLSVIKLLGGGEYVAEGPSGSSADAHFALAVSNYTHSTAPNRRYPDLITQRLVKAAMANEPSPYTLSDLTTLAEHCTAQEDAATKVERLVRKAASALWLSSRVGDEFAAVVTGASAKGTWVRLAGPPIEGKLERGYEGLDVGDAVRVKLVHVDPERGFIDFVAVAGPAARSSGASH
ncbi:MAG: RNB domain-containing ribonuclease [Vicinamibacterales bacterium]